MSNNVSRRDALKLLNKVGGTAAASSVIGMTGAFMSLDAAAYPDIQQWRNEDHGQSEEQDILILGAGISGLTAAYELSKAGYKVTVLEARDRPGGRNETVRRGSIIEETDNPDQRCRFGRRDHLYFNVGPGRISHLHYRLLAYCRELGVKMEVMSNHNDNARMVFDGYNGEANTLRRVRYNQQGQIAENLAEAIQRGTLSDIIPPELETSYLNMLRSYGELNEDFQFLGTTKAGLAQDSGVLTPPEPMEKLDLTDFINAPNFVHIPPRYGEQLNQQSTMLQPVDGMDAIPRAFAKYLRQKIRYNAEVSSIRRVEGGAEVEYTSGGRRRTLFASKVIVTIPLPVLANIDNDFSPDIQQEIAHANYSSAAKIAYMSPRFWEQEDQIYGGISWVSRTITQMWYPSAGIGRKKGVLVGGYTFGGPAGDFFAELTPEQRTELALSEGELLHPNLREHARSAISRSWKKTKYSLGGWSENPPIEAYNRADGPYIYAGDHTTFLSGWQEGAVASAHRAINLVSKM